MYQVVQNLWKQLFWPHNQGAKVHLFGAQGLPTLIQGISTCMHSLQCTLFLAVRVVALSTLPLLSIDLLIFIAFISVLSEIVKPYLVIPINLKRPLFLRWWKLVHG